MLMSSGSSSIETSFMEQLEIRISPLRPLVWLRKSGAKTRLLDDYISAQSLINGPQFVTHLMKRRNMWFKSRHASTNCVSSCRQMEPNSLGTT